tara:strand:+ start:682 stop:1824 length:1143 start_codon:yes stop_codon:yes gene_type:complete
MQTKEIPFNKPHLTGQESIYLEQAVKYGQLSGNGVFTKKCQSFFEDRYGIKKCLLTTSCTDALELAALTLDIQVGDEIIMPSYTFVSTANAFALRGAKIVFCDSRDDHPGMDEDQIWSLITSKTKAIVVVHYAGVACDMDKLASICKHHQLYLVEDVAHGIEAKYNGRALGTFGDLAAFSFHETKNIHSGEGGLLAINNKDFLEKAEIIWEKGTNRAAFWRGEVDKYEWQSLGSSFLPSELNAAFLWAQLQEIERIQRARVSIWEAYYSNLSSLNFDWLTLPTTPAYGTNNGHLFYLNLSSDKLRSNLKKWLANKGINSISHYQCLHSSPFHTKTHEKKTLLKAEHYEKCLLRLPFFYDLQKADIQFICNSIEDFNKFHL